MTVLAIFAALLLAVTPKVQSEDTPTPPKPIFKIDTPGVATVPLEGPITAESVQQTVVSIVAASKQSKIVILRINSPGGSYSDGFNLVRFIEMAPIPIACVVDGEAFSMAFIILQSCPARLMTKRSVLMYHEPGMRVGGQRQDMANATAALTALTLALNEEVGVKLKMTIAQIAEKVSGGKEWYMAHIEALAINAVDMVVAKPADILPMVGQLAAMLGAK